MQAMNALSPSQSQPQHHGPAQPVALPAAPSVWTPAHHFHRIHDPVSFAWLNSRSPATVGAVATTARCFGMDVAYVALDMLLWFPNEIVLAIPFLDAPPPEYFLVCNAGGQRWWCFVVLRKGSVPTALVFDVDPSVLLIAGLGLRETHVDAEKGVVSRGRDFGYPPNAAVLCPMDAAPIRHERLNPATQEYFCVREAGAVGHPATTPTLANVLAPRHLPPAMAAMEVSIGTPVLGLRMRINEDEALMRWLGSLNDGSGGAP